MGTERKAGVGREMRERERERETFIGICHTWLHNSRLVLAVCRSYTMPTLHIRKRGIKRGRGGREREKECVGKERNTDSDREKESEQR